MRPQKFEPVDIAFAKAHCVAISVHRPHGHYGEIGFERFQDSEVVPELAKRYKLICSQCGARAMDTRPVYPKTPGQI